MLDKLIQAARAAADTAPVETRLYFDEAAVHVQQRVFTGNKWFAFERLIPWPEVVYARFDVLEFYIKAGREALLAEWEGPDSTNPNREHGWMSP